MCPPSIRLKVEFLAKHFFSDRPLATLENVDTISPQRSIGKPLQKFCYPSFIDIVAQAAIRTIRADGIRECRFDPWEGIRPDLVFKISVGCIPPPTFSCSCHTLILSMSF